MRPEPHAHVQPDVEGETVRSQRGRDNAAEAGPVAASGAAQNPACVCHLSLPCGVHLREQRSDEARRPAVAPSRRYRNTEGLRGHANARKRASD